MTNTVGRTPDTDEAFQRWEAVLAGRRPPEDETQSAVSLREALSPPAEHDDVQDQATLDRMMARLEARGALALPAVGQRGAASRLPAGLQADLDALENLDRDGPVAEPAGGLAAGQALAPAATPAGPRDAARQLGPAPRPLPPAGVAAATRHPWRLGSAAFAVLALVLIGFRALDAEAPLPGLPARSPGPASPDDGLATRGLSYMALLPGQTIWVDDPAAAAARLVSQLGPFGASVRLDADGTDRLVHAQLPDTLPPARLAEADALLRGQGLVLPPDRALAVRFAPRPRSAPGT